MTNFDATQQLSANKTMISSTPGSQATLMGTPVKCPVCGTENAPTEKYCGDCGFLLSSTPVDDVQAVESAEQARFVDTASQLEFYLRQGENTAGRESSDVLVSHPTVSRRHARIILEGDKCWIEDLGSTNGTFVGNRQLQPGEKVELSDGTEVRFGSAALVLKLPVGTETVSILEEVESTEEQVEEPESALQVETVEALVAEEIIAEEETPVQDDTSIGKLVSASGVEREFKINSGTTTVGRRIGKDIMIADDPYVSGSHAEIIVDQLGIWLVDTDSTNGTILNGDKITSNTRMALNDSDEVTFGRTALRFLLNS